MFCLVCGVIHKIKDTSDVLHHNNLFSIQISKLSLFLKFYSTSKDPEQAYDRTDKRF